MNTPGKAATPPGNPRGGAKDVLVIVPAYRAPETLARCLAQVRAQTVAHRVFSFVRDNSDDNIFFTAAVNAGLRYGLERPEFRYFMVLNQDCMLADDAVEKLLACFAAHPQAGICAPLQLDPDRPEQVTWGGSAQTFPWGAHVVGVVGDFTQVTPVAWANGAAMMLRRELVVDIGLLDAGMRMVASDADYSLTARSRGWPVLLCPAARCFHALGASRAGGGGEAMEALKIADALRFADKWFSGELYRTLSVDAATMNLGELRRQRDALAASLTRLRR